jgi:hypothetical protein
MRKGALFFSSTISSSSFLITFLLMERKLFHSCPTPLLDNCRTYSSLMEIFLLAVAVLLLLINKRRRIGERYREFILVRFISSQNDFAISSRISSTNPLSILCCNSINTSEVCIQFSSCQIIGWKGNFESLISKMYFPLFRYLFF